MSVPQEALASESVLSLMARQVKILQRQTAPAVPPVAIEY
jgi:hypothetical protein